MPQVYRGQALVLRCHKRGPKFDVSIPTRSIVIRLGTAPGCQARAPGLQVALRPQACQLQVGTELMSQSATSRVRYTSQMVRQGNGAVLPCSASQRHGRDVVMGLLVK